MKGPDANDIHRELGPDGLRKTFDETPIFSESPSNGDGETLPAKRIRLIPFEDITLSLEPPYLVRGLLPRNGLTVIWGPPKSGKSFWVFDAAMHVALGWEYRGRRVHQGPVVYCAFEGQGGIGKRAEAFRRHFLTDRSARQIPLYFVTVNLDLVRDHRKLIEAITATLDGVAPALIVLDTLNRSLRGSESSDQDMSSYVNAADNIRDAFSCAIIVVHHCGIDPNRPRGHTSLTGADDAQLAVKRDAANNIAVKVEFMKDGVEGDEIVSRLEVIELGTDDDGETITSCVVIPAGPAAANHQDNLRGSAKIAFDLLKRALAEESEPVPTSNHSIPPNTRTIRIDLWRRYCDEGMIASTDKPDSKRKAFVRATHRLQELGLIGVWNDYVWITGQAGQ